MASKGNNRKRRIKHADRVIGTLGAVDDAVAMPFKRALSIKSVFESLGENGPVRSIKERIGELANLPDPWDNLRSKAAILAKKHQEKSQKLRNIYNAGTKRELTQDEVASVFAIWEGIKNGVSEQLENELAGAGGRPIRALDAARDGSGSEGAEEGGGDGGHDEDLASGLAGSSEDEGDSCL